MKNDYYVYVYSHPDTRQPFYVGKVAKGEHLMCAPALPLYLREDSSSEGTVLTIEYSHF